MSPYALMLRLYPDGHPRDEMLGVLEEGGRAWYREAPSLLAGALRARTGGDHPARLRWLYAARAAALMLLVAAALAPVLDLYYSQQLATNRTIATWVCAGLAVVAVAFGGRVWALGLAASALVLSAADQISMPAIAGYALATALLLIPGRSLPVRNPLPILLALAWAADYTLPEGVWLALIAAVLLWTVIDERILLATGLALLAGVIVATGQVTEAGDARGLLLMAALRLGLPAALLAFAGTLTYRRARI
ncbi:hypothetical protein ACQP2F_19380 [Actinoplanes sp. CA-030573]|uniref:hypothetical protein n=1 Tax=Actinoplanes sp. CA-030573 TaxID=3239898 RepID=UPI003D9213AC